MASEHNDRIGQAIEEWVQSLPGEDPGILGDWIVVASMVAVDEQGTPRCEYYLGFRGGTMLPHVAKGLLSEGMDQVELSRSEDD